MTFWSIKVNNFFLFILLLIYGAFESGVEPKSAEPLLLVLGLLVLVPASSDPMAKIPASRFGLWPLRMGQRVALRLGSLALSPVTGVMVLIFGRSGSWETALGFLAFAGIVQVALAAGVGLASVVPGWNLMRYVPQFPGKLGGLIRNNLREMFTLLDFYLAVFLSIGGCCYRYLGKDPDPSAAPAISVLVALALSTFAQSLFGLELGPGMTRYRLLPLRGWEVLLAKDLAFVAVLGVLTAPLALGPGMAFGLIALALGHHSSVYQGIILKKWRFAGGRLLPVGAVQALGGITAGFGAIQHGAAVLSGAAGLWAVSVWWCGRRLE